MKYFGEKAGELHKELSRIIRKPAEFDRARQLFLDLHAMLHTSIVSGGEYGETDCLLSDLAESDFYTTPSTKDETIAWSLWHIARIEDLTMNFLVARREQVFDSERQRRLNVTVTDTGNAMTDNEISVFSRRIDGTELIEYRTAVGMRTREIVSALTASDMKRKVSAEDCRKIYDAGGVTDNPDSVWLLDFWGGKDVAGLLLMPATRHIILHLNNCCKVKENIRNKAPGR